MTRIAIVNTCISGSTGKIAVGLHDYLRKHQVDVFFCYGREDGPTEDTYYRIGNTLDFILHIGLTRVFGLQGFGSLLATRKLIGFLKKQKINVVYIISPHGYYLNEKGLLSYLSANNIKTIYLMIDEYAFSGKCPYQNGCEEIYDRCRKCPQKKAYPQSLIFDGASKIYGMKKKQYKKFKDITFVGPEYVVNQAKKSPLMTDMRFSVLDEAINTNFFSPRDPQVLINELKIDGSKKILLNVAPYSVARKGCRFFLELARRFQYSEEYVFIQVGFDVDKNMMNLPQNYIPIGFVSDQEKLAQYYSLADLFVFPSLQDTMPNACLEALSSGTPLLCFNTSGLPFIADNTVATFVEAENVDKMVEYVREMKKKTDDEVLKCRNYAMKRYDNQLYYKNLIELAK